MLVAAICSVYSLRVALIGVLLRGLSWRFEVCVHGALVHSIASQVRQRGLFVMCTVARPELHVQDTHPLSIIPLDRLERH